jgi:hypothetical protein
MIIPVHSRPFADNLKMPKKNVHRYTQINTLGQRTRTMCTKKNVHRYTQINTDEENCGVKICGYLWPSVDKFLMRSPLGTPTNNKTKWPSVDKFLMRSP